MAYTTVLEAVAARRAGSSPAPGTRLRTQRSSRTANAWNSAAVPDSPPPGSAQRKVRVIRKSLTGIARRTPEASSGSIAQREMNPMPSPARTADRIASFSPRTKRGRSSVRPIPAPRSASSTTFRVPDPDSRQTIGSAARSAADRTRPTRAISAAFADPGA